VDLRAELSEEFAGVGATGEGGGGGGRGKRELHPNIQEKRGLFLEKKERSTIEKG